MKSAIIIPARYASQRLPGKPLLRSTGKYLVQHVYEQACRANRAGAVIVATDDSRIEAAVKGFGGRVVRTRPDHPSGTDRVAEVADGLDADVIVNLQGDEPQVNPGDLDLLPELLEHAPLADVATLAAPIRTLQQWQNPSCVKVVCDVHGRALYFSRSPIPYVRDGKPDLKATPPRFLVHIGIYAYRRSFLLKLASTRPQPLEQLEKLEQLRVLALGKHIQVGITRHASTGIDTYDDYLRFVENYRQGLARLAA